MKRTHESGSHVIVLAVAVLVVGVLAFAGYRVYQMQQAANNTPSASTTADATPPAQITNTTTLKQAGNALDAAAVELNSNLDDSALNTSMSSML